MQIAEVKNSRASESLASSLPETGQDRSTAVQVKWPFHRLFERSTLGMALADFEGRLLEVNAALCQLTGRDEAELLALDLAELFHPGDRNIDQQALLQLEAGQIEHYQTKKRVIQKDGRPVWRRVIVSLVRDSAGRASHRALQFEPSAEAVFNIPGAISGDSYFRELADAAPVLIWSAAPDRSCEYVNRGWLDFVGRDQESELGQGWTDNLHPDDRHPTISLLISAYEARTPFEVEYRLRRHDGQYRWLLSAGVPRFKPDGQFVGYVGSCIDITDRKETQLELQRLLSQSELAQAQLAEQTRRLHDLAELDHLTGVLNRRSFCERFAAEWSRAARHSRPLSCIMLDIDFFKKINDTYGHATGDAILKQVAQRIAQACRPSDLVCRWGGEEFCIMVPETDEAGAATFAERLRSALASMAVELAGVTIRFTSSFGLAERSSDTHEFEELIERADQALHIAKHAGRNRVVRFASESAFAELLTQDSPSSVLSKLTAGELVTPTPCVHCDETIGRAVELLLRHAIGSAPVVDDQGKLVGFISERDLMLLDVSPESWSRKVREIMKTNVVCYDAGVAGSQIFQFLCRVSIHRIVVVKNDKPIGIISPSGLLHYFKRCVCEPAGGNVPRV